MAKAKEKEIVYIAGKISGDKGYRRKFAHAAAVLEKLGYIVISPAMLPAGLDYEAYMRIDAAMMEEANTICFLPDWRQSKGACREHIQAQLRGKQLMYYPSAFAESDWRASI